MLRPSFYCFFFDMSCWYEVNCGILFFLYFPVAIYPAFALGGERCIPGLAKFSEIESSGTILGGGNHIYSLLYVYV